MRAPQQDNLRTGPLPLYYPFLDSHGLYLAGERRMVEPMMIDLKALLVEREDCDAGTVQQLRNGLAQGGNQYRTLRDVTEMLKKKLETAQPAQAKKWHLKLGVAYFFLGY